MIRSILSSVFGLGVALRNAAYDHGIFRVHDIPVPVISVGNISVGGTGKTPVVQHVAARLLASYRTALVTRGYGRTTTGTFLVSDGRGTIADVASSGDEPVMVARNLPELIVVADEKRARGCGFAIEQAGASVLVLDDAYQHRSCNRTMDIVVIDASKNLPDDRVVPAGSLREPVRNLGRASMLVLSRCTDQSSSRALLEFLRRYTTVPMFRTRFVTTDILPLFPGSSPPMSFFQGRPMLTFCGIGAPASFQTTLQELGIRSVHQVNFPDHFAYTASSIQSLLGKARAAGVNELFTTEKDAVRLHAFDAVFGDYRVYYPRMKLDFLDDEDEFFDMIERRCFHG